MVAVGLGQALDIARRGDADALVVHDQAVEDGFVAEGFGLRRHAVMYIDFVLTGPKTDPPTTRGSASHRIRKISNAAFTSRGDKIGAHRAERYWTTAGLASQQGGGNRECGCGMRPTPNMAAESGAYVLADRGTWLAFKNRGELAVLIEGDKRLFNQYDVIVVNPARNPHVKAAQAQQFADWIVSPAGQAAIAAYRIGGEQLFFPNAGQ